MGAQKTKDIFYFSIIHLYGNSCNIEIEKRIYFISAQYIYKVSILPLNHVILKLRNDISSL